MEKALVLMNRVKAKAVAVKVPGYACEDGIPDLLFASFLTFYSWHYYCLTTRQGTLGAALSFTSIIGIVTLLWLSLIFQRKKPSSRKEAGLPIVTIIAVLMPSLTTIPALRFLVMDSLLVQLAVWLIFWEALGFATKLPRYFAYGFWAVAMYWVTLAITKGYHFGLLGFPYLVMSVLCATIPLLCGAMTFLKYVRERITLRTELKENM